MQDKRDAREDTGLRATSASAWLLGVLASADLAAHAPDELENATGELLARGLEGCKRDVAEQCHLRTDAVGAAGVDKLRSALRQAVVTVGRQRDRSAAQREALAAALLGLVIILQRDRNAPNWPRRDHRILQLLEEWSGLPRSLRTAISISRRHPTAATSKTVQAEVWRARNSLTPHDPPTGPHDVRAWTQPGTLVSGPQASGERPADLEAEYVLDLDPDRLLHLVLNGKRMPYGNASRGGHLTRNHRGAPLLVQLCEGCAPKSPPTEPLRDLRQALRGATGGALNVLRRADRYVLSQRIILTERVRTACRRG